MVEKKGFSSSCMKEKEKKKKNTVRRNGKNCTKEKGKNGEKRTGKELLRENKINPVSRSTLMSPLCQNSPKWSRILGYILEQVRICCIQYGTKQKALWSKTLCSQTKEGEWIKACSRISFWKSPLHRICSVKRNVVPMLSFEKSFSPLTVLL